MKLTGWILASVLAAVSASVAPGPAQAGGEDEVPRPTFQEARAEAVAQLIDDIGKYAGWCTGQKLFAERDRAWNVVLGLEPDNEEAHKALGHKRKDGEWAPDPRRAPPKNRNDKKLEEAPERWTKTIAPYRDRMLALMDEYADDLGALGRTRELAALLAIDPDDPVLRARNGEVQEEGEWVLKETATAARRRPALAKLVQEAADGAPAPELLELDDLESELAVAWTHTLVSPVVRVLSTGSEAEATTAVKVAHAAGALFESVYGEAPEYPSPMRFILLANAEDKAALFSSHPGIDDATERFFERVEGAGVPDSGDFCHWATTAPKRVDGITRAMIGWLAHKKLGLTPEIGWIHEGFGIYLTRVLLGTRLNWFVLPIESSSTAENQALLAKMYDSSVNWVQLAYEQLKGERPPRLARFLKKRLDQLNADELLYSYALAAYLIEGRPDETPELLRRIGAGEDQDKVIREVLGMDLDELDARVLKWLSQRR